MSIDNEFTPLGEKRLRESRRRAAVVPAPKPKDQNKAPRASDLNRRPDFDNDGD